MKRLNFDWANGQGADLVRDIAQQVSAHGRLWGNTIELSNAKRHFWGLKPDELLLNGEDKELLAEFAQTFGLRLTFGDFDLSAILSVR